MVPTVKKSREEIDRQIDLAMTSINEGGSKYPGMSYEEGVRNGIEWVLGEVEEAPMEED